MRSHLFDLFHTQKTDRKVSFWYGARSKREMFYDDQFKDIEKDFPNFTEWGPIRNPKTTGTDMSASSIKSCWTTT